MNIVNIIIDETKEHLDKVAVIDSGREITYSDLFTEVENFKKELLSLGIAGRRKVALFLPDSIEYIVISLAVLSLDCVVVPVSPSLAWDEVEGVVKKIDVDYLISSKKIDISRIHNEFGQFKCKDKTVFVYERKSILELNEEFYGLNPAFIRFSSGTTSTSKGVVISHESILERTNAANNGLNITPSDNIVWVLSMSYHFVVTIILFLRKAATIILCEDEFPSVMLESFEKYNCTFMYASPFHYRMMISSDDVKKNYLANLRMAISTAVEFTEKEILRFSDMFGVEISEAYGIIEVGLPFVNVKTDTLARGSVGQILPDYQMQIRDADDEGVGAIYLKGKGMFDAYYSPWQTREQVLDDGWFNTGDIGFIDENGFLFIRGREKNVINFCGMKIFPREVEEVLKLHEEVKESYVYGVLHEVYGQLPHADVVLNGEKENCSIIQILRKFCYNNLASYKVPKEICAVKEIKKTESGKILRSKI